ncbi:TPA: hypothetical protein ACK24L_000179 [Klebsiella oxytoca]
MTWETIFDGVVMGDHITVEWDVDDEDEGEFPVKVKITNKSPAILTPPIIDGNSVIIPPPPDDPSKRYTIEYDSIDDMYAKIASDTGRPNVFGDELEKAIQSA